MVKFSMYVLTKIYTFLSFKIKYYVVRKVSFFRKRVFYNSAPSYKRETKSVKCRGVYLNETKWIVRNSTK